MKTLKPKILREKIRYKGKWASFFGVDVLVAGKKFYWEYIKGGNAVAVVPVEGKDVYLVKEYRVPWKRYVVQIPSGGCQAATESGRLRQARNELREETGMDARRMEKLVVSINTARNVSTHHIYLATGLFPSPKKPDEGEYTEVIKMPIRKAFRMFLKEQTPAYSLLGIMLAMERLKI